MTQRRWVDSHCHLDFPALKGDLEGVLSRARAAGVGCFLTIGTKLQEMASVIAIAEAHPDVYCTVGIHPHEADDNVERLTGRLVEWSAHPKVVGVGETGLDFYYDHAARDAQERSFRAHIQASRDTGLPLVIHSRDADDKMARILEEEIRIAPFTGLLHCFTSSRQLAETALDLGLLISFSGIVTFKSAGDLQSLLPAIPLERLLVETDAPYLAPVPMRGKSNEPSFMIHTAEKVAAIKGLEKDALAEATTNNFFALFSKAARPVELA